MDLAERALVVAMTSYRGPAEPRTPAALTRVTTA